MQLINLNKRMNDQQSQIKLTGTPISAQNNVPVSGEIQISNGDFTTGTYKENLDLLLKHQPNKLLYSLRETASLIGVSYEYIRINVRSGKVAVKNFGSRKLIHVNEISRIITEGITD